jgi:predicted DNA-binding transcriptional regulator YafY
MGYRQDYDTILKRLTTILARLNTGETLSVKALAEEFGVSVRTIQRDFNERLIHHFPIHKEGRKWRLPAGHRIEKTTDLHQQIVLDILEKMAEGVGGDFAVHAKTLLKKLHNAEPNPIYAKLYIEEIADRFDAIGQLEKAIAEHRCIACLYSDERHEPYSVTLEPLKIVNYEGFWYLLAQHKGRIKKYYLKNLHQPRLLEESFAPDARLEQALHDSISVWFDPDKEPIEVRLYADATAARYFRRRPLPTQTIEGQDRDGSIEMSVRITHPMEIIPIIKYWIPHLRILSPDSIAQQIEQDIRQYLSP